MKTPKPKPETDKIMKTENDNTSPEVPLVLTGIRIDADVLRAKSACEDGFRAFTTRWPNGCDYQEALHWLAEINRADWASWLMRKIGSAQTETIIEGSLKVGNLFVAGHLVVRGNIEAGGGIKAGGNIEAGCGIEAGWGIKAGGGIKAGCGIEAGGGIKATWIDCALRIFAGLVNRRLPTPEEMEIRAEIRRGTVAYGTLVETNRKA